MQGSWDSQFDEYIVRALKAETTVTPRQQQRAWEALRQKAAQQTILPPLESPLYVRLWKKTYIWSKTWLTGLYNFILDDTVYRRAQHPYSRMMRHQRPHSTFASAEFMLLA
jgi:hypothetical protein